MKREIKRLTSSLPALREGYKVFYRDHVYWLQRDWESDGNDLRLASEDIYRQSEDEEILGGILGCKYGEVHSDKVYRTEP